MINASSNAEIWKISSDGKIFFIRLAQISDGKDTGFPGAMVSLGRNTVLSLFAFEDDIAADDFCVPVDGGSVFAFSVFANLSGTNDTTPITVAMQIV